MTEIESLRLLLDNIRHISKEVAKDGDQWRLVKPPLFVLSSEKNAGSVTTVIKHTTCTHTFLRARLGFIYSLVL